MASRDYGRDQYEGNGERFRSEWSPYGSEGRRFGRDLQYGGEPYEYGERFGAGERRYVSLRVSTRGLRTIEKNGIEKVVADLRAQGVSV